MRQKILIDEFVVRKKDHFTICNELSFILFTFLSCGKIYMPQGNYNTKKGIMQYPFSKYLQQFSQKRQELQDKFYAKATRIKKVEIFFKKVLTNLICCGIISKSSARDRKPTIENMLVWLNGRAADL